MSFPAPRQRAGGTAQGRPGSLARPGSRVHYGKPNQGSSNEKRAPVLYLVQQTKSRKFKRKKGAGSLSGSSRNGRRTAQRARAGTASRRLPALRRGRPGRRPAGAPAVITFVRQTLCPSNTLSVKHFGNAPPALGEHQEFEQQEQKKRKCMLSIAWAAQPRRRRRGSRGRRSA